MRDSASSSDDFLRVDLPAEIWRNSDRPRFGAVIRLYVAVTLTITAVVMLSPGPLYWGLIAGAVAVFALTPTIVNRRLDGLEQRLQELDPTQANNMLRELPKRRLVRYFAPFAWLPLQQARLHLRRGDGRAAALAFAETARISRVDASTPALVSAEATAALMGGDRKRALQLLRKLEQQNNLRPQDHLHFGLALLLERGKPAAAQTHLEAAQEGLGGHPRVLAGLAFASQRAGDPKRAAELLEAIAASEVAVDPLASDLIRRTEKGLRTFLKARNKRSKRSKRERANVVKQNPTAEPKPVAKPVVNKPVAAKPVADKPAPQQHVEPSTSLPETTAQAPTTTPQAAESAPGKKKQPKRAKGKKARKQARREARRRAKAEARAKRKAEQAKSAPNEPSSKQRLTAKPTTSKSPDVATSGEAARVTSGTTEASPTDVTTIEPKVASKPPQASKLTKASSLVEPPGTSARPEATKPASTPATKSASTPATKLASTPATKSASTPATKLASTPATKLTSTPATKPASTPARFQGVPNHASTTSVAPPVKPAPKATSTTVRTPKPSAPPLKLSTVAKRPPTGTSLFGQGRPSKSTRTDLPTRKGLPTRSPGVSAPKSPAVNVLGPRPSKPVPAGVSPVTSKVPKLSIPKIGPVPTKPRLATAPTPAVGRPRSPVPRVVPPTTASVPNIPQLAPPRTTSKPVAPHLASPPSVPPTAPPLAPPVAPTVGMPIVAPTLTGMAPSVSVPAVSAPQLRRVETPAENPSAGLFSDDDWDDVLSAVDELDLGA